MAEYGIDTVPDGTPADAGNHDNMAGTLAAAMSMAMARYDELHSDTIGAGSTIGDPMNVASVMPDLDPGVDSLSAFDEKAGAE